MILGIPVFPRFYPPSETPSLLSVSEEIKPFDLEEERENSTEPPGIVLLMVYLTPVIEKE